MKKNLPTEAGQTDSRKLSGEEKTQRVDALNQCFALLELNYHNQFLKAYSDQEKLNTAKRLWFEALAQYTPATLLSATKAVISVSEFLPTLKTMLDHCEAQSGRGVPDAHSAYVEACCAASPKVEQRWSHAIVYLAGKQTGWLFLQQNSENIAFPVFRDHFNRLADRVRKGEVLTMPTVEKLEQPPFEPASPELVEERIKALNELFK